MDSLVLLTMSLASVALAAEPPLTGSPPTQIVAELRIIQTAQAKGADAIDPLRLRYKTLAQQRPGEVMLRVYLAMCDVPSDGAWNQLKNVLAVEPNNLWARYGVARTYNAWKMKDEARREWDALLKADRQFYLAYVGAGEFARSVGDDALAEKQFRQSLAIADNPWAHGALGQLQAAQGKTDASKAELLTSLKQWPEQPKIISALLSLLPDHQIPEAVGLLVSLASIDPKNKEARLAVAKVKDAEGKPKEAVQEYERLVRLGDAAPESLRRLAELYRSQNDEDGEERTLNLLASRDKDSPSANLRLAELAQGKNDFERAEGQLLEALARAPTEASAHLQLGRLKLARQLTHEALESFRAGAQLATAGNPSPAVNDCSTEAETIEKQLRLVAPAKGTVDAIYTKVSRDLAQFYAVQKKRAPALAGQLALRVRIDGQGVVRGVDVLSDSAKDPLLLAFAYFSLKQAEYPKAKRDPVFEFEFGKRPAAKAGPKAKP